MTVTTQTIVENLETMIKEIREDRKLDTEKRARLIQLLVGRQIQAGTLHLHFRKAVARLPEDSDKAIPLLSSS